MNFFFFFEQKENSEHELTRKEKEEEKRREMWYDFQQVGKSQSNQRSELPRFVL